MPLGRQTETLHAIAERLHQPPLRQIVAKPGVSEGFRVTVFYATGEPGSVATLINSRGGKCAMTVVYDKRSRPEQFDLALSVERYQKLMDALRGHKFDRLDDQPNLPYSANLWLLERASGSFFRDVLVAPESAAGSHAGLVEALRDHVPEAVRALTV